MKKYVVKYAGTEGRYYKEHTSRPMNYEEVVECVRQATSPDYYHPLPIVAIYEIKEELTINDFVKKED